MKLTRFEQLEALVLQWADDKGILKNGTKLGQAKKTIEEAKEIRDAIEEKDLFDEGIISLVDESDEEFDFEAAIIDGIGDTLVTLIIQAEMNNLDILDCLETAYTEIAGRQGKMINGQFVKDE